jgi:hypothetical protein
MVNHSVGDIAFREVHDFLCQPLFIHFPNNKFLFLLMIEEKYV